MSTTIQSQTTTSAEAYLRAFLNIYWLRPENAMWRAVNCMAMEDLVFEAPSLDSSCGDGLFSFLRAKGALAIGFDVYSAVDKLEAFYEGADIYDAWTDSYEPLVTRTPDYMMDWGIDWKQELLNKAGSLGFYRNLKVHDNNQTLPFDDGYFKTIFSNSAYWVPNLDLHLGELSRVLHAEGRCILVLMTSMTREVTLERYAGDLGQDWLALIDRGRKENYKGLRPPEEWDGILERCGFEIESKRPQITWVHSMIEYVGLRPISPVMIKMAQALPAEKRSELKQEWIDTWTQLLLPFVKPGLDLGQLQPPVELVYVLRKTR